MSYNFQYKFLNRVSLDDLLHVFNQSFTDYFVPMNLDEAALKAKIKTEGIQLSESIGVYANKKLVGFILHGKKNTKLYNAGTGVLPEFRGNMLTNKMYEYAMPIFRSFKISKISLEVIATNETAMKAYRKVGFKKWRHLNCIKGATKINSKLDPSYSEIEIKPLPFYEYLIYYAEKDILPTWQNSEFCIENNETKLLLRKAVLNNQTLGYIIIDKSNNKILQIWVKDCYRRKGIATYLVEELIGNRQTFLVTNIDAQNFGINSFLKSIGGEDFLEQVEMELYL